ncbi:MAG: hypothetical protein WC955_13170, partial [Elusimicrobiota bacterium]
KMNNKYLLSVIISLFLSSSTEHLCAGGYINVDSIYCAKKPGQEKKYLLKKEMNLYFSETQNYAGESWAHICAYGIRNGYFDIDYWIETKYVHFVSTSSAEQLFREKKYDEALREYFVIGYDDNLLDDELRKRVKKRMLDIEKCMDGIEKELLPGVTYKDKKILFRNEIIVSPYHPVVFKKHKLVCNKTANAFDFYDINGRLRYSINTSGRWYELAIAPNEKYIILYFNDLGAGNTVLVYDINGNLKARIDDKGIAFITLVYFNHTSTAFNILYMGYLINTYTTAGKLVKTIKIR